MRVTQKSLQDTWVRDIQRRLENLDRLNRQIGSGQKVERPSDAPAGAARIVRIEDVVARNEQYLKNIEEALAVHRSTDTALEQAYNHLMRAKTLAVEAANAASVPVSGSFAALADEVADIRTGILQIALTRHESEYLFGGTAGQVAPFQQEGGAYRYQGNSGRLRVNIGNGLSVAVNLPGDLAFRETEARSSSFDNGQVVLSSDVTFTVSDGSEEVDITISSGTYTLSQIAASVNQRIAEYENTNGKDLNVTARANGDGTWSLVIEDTEEGGEITVSGAGDLGIASGTKNLFGLLDDLEEALRAEDPDQVAGLLDRLDRALNDLLTQRGLVGSRTRNLERARERLEAFNLSAERLRADIEGVDLPEAVMRLSAEEQAYQTALAAGARLFNVSILDFLR